MESMKSIMSHTGNKGSVITNINMLTSETLIDIEDFNIINNNVGHSDIFQPDTFGGLSEVNVSL